MLTAVPKGKSPREIWPWLASQAPLGGCTDKPGIPEGAGCHLSLRTARPRGPAWRRPPSAGVRTPAPPPLQSAQGCGSPQGCPPGCLPLNEVKEARGAMCQQQNF